MFVTLGHIQPEDRVLSILKYIPDFDGSWCANGRHYRRVFSSGTASATSGMPLAPHDYTVHDSHFGTELLEPPKNAIARYYSPELRLKEILEEGPKDRLERAVKTMTETIHDILGLPIERLGVTGSIVWKAHDPIRSDINMNVYGLEGSQQLHDNFEKLIEQSPEIRLVVAQDWHPWITRLKERIPEYPEDALTTLFSRRKGLFCHDLYVSVVPVLLPQETPILHGSESYETVSHDPIRIETTLRTTSFSTFTPALYDCESNLVNKIKAKVTRIMVYDGVFSNVFLTGDRVEVKGTLQHVTRQDGTAFYQLMVGTKRGAGREYIRLID